MTNPEQLPEKSLGLEELDSGAKALARILEAATGYNTLITQQLENLKALGVPVDMIASLQIDIGQLGKKVTEVKADLTDRTELSKADKDTLFIRELKGRLSEGTKYTLNTFLPPDELQHLQEILGSNVPADFYTTAYDGLHLSVKIGMYLKAPGYRGS